MHRYMTIRVLFEKSTRNGNADANAVNLIQHHAISIQLSTKSFDSVTPFVIHSNTPRALLANLY